MTNTCTHCGNSTQTRGWSLRHYFGISGYFCSPCYDLVSHDSYQQPNKPAAYMMVLLKQSGSKYKE